MKKRLIPILGLVLVMLFCVIGLVACQKEKYSKGLEYASISPAEYEVVGIGACKDIKIIIPSKYKNKAVTSIGRYAFSDCRSLTGIEIPDSVTSIGYGAFSDCNSLTSIEIPDSVTSMGDRAFFSCDSLISVEIGDGVISTGNYAFSSCDSLISVEIGDGVISIGERAFSFCKSLISVEIGDSVTSIGDSAFYYCTSLASITFNGTRAEWNRIEKGSDWKYNTKATYVTCTDGTVYI